jgi:hypothetical protein
MSIDEKTVRKVAKLARLALPEDRVKPMADELNGIMAWIEQLNEVDIEGVEPMTSAERAEVGGWILRRAEGGGVSGASILLALDGRAVSARSAVTEWVVAPYLDGFVPPPTPSANCVRGHLAHRGRGGLG